MKIKGMPAFGGGEKGKGHFEDAGSVLFLDLRGSSMNFRF